MADESETQANLARARESLRAAKSLAEDGFHDFAASRSYYAVFYAASAVLDAEGVGFTKHGGLITAVHQYLIKPGRLEVAFGKDLRFLYEMRLVGDYGESRHVPEDEAAKAIEIAERLVDELSGLLDVGEGSAHSGSSD